MENDNRRTLIVDGRSKMRVLPDLIILDISIENKDTKISNINEKSKSDYNKIESAIVSAGLDKESLKTSDISVNSKSGTFFDKVNFIQKLSLKMDLDNTLLSNVLDKISKTGIKFSYNLNYSLKDETVYELSNTLLEKACKNAHETALVISGSTGVKLLDIVNIEYHNYPIDVERIGMTREMSTMDFMEMSQEKVENINLNPKEIKLDTSISIEWEIE